MTRSAAADRIAIPVSAISRGSRTGAQRGEPRSGLTALPPLSLYIHLPWCLSKCPYCDFNSHVRHAPPDQERFAAAFARELSYFADLTPGR
ncbi:MAG: hypothetical protein RIS35_3307, partial [Pseudomonadota bacterium]